MSLLSHLRKWVHSRDAEMPVYQEPLAQRNGNGPIDIPGMEEVQMEQGAGYALHPHDEPSEKVKEKLGEKRMKTVETKIIGVFPISNTGGICVHAIDHAEDKVLASINGENPEWCAITEKPQPEMGVESEELELGFMFGSFFVPFYEVMRVGI